jgi:hypothetical protein
MTDKYFLTEILYLHKGLLYLIEDDIVVKVDKTNYSNALSFYGWEDIDFIWESQIGDAYLILDCGSSGDCLFHSIAEALNLKQIYSNSNNVEELDFYHVDSLRKAASSKITSDNFNLILESYKLEDELGEFQGDWDPNKITRIEELQSEIEKSGNNFWGDHITIQLLSTALQINFVILNCNDDEDVSYTTVEIPGNKGFIILYYLNNCHFTLVGKFDGKRMNVIFKTIPNEIKKCLM